MRDRIILRERERREKDLERDRERVRKRSEPWPEINFLRSSELCRTRELNLRHEKRKKILLCSFQIEINKDHFCCCNRRQLAESLSDVMNEK